MLKKIVALATLALASMAALAAVEANKGSAAELDALPGVGPALSQRILDARKQGDFKDWNDLMARVKGVKEKAAAKLSGAGLTVNGKPYADAPKAAAPAPKK
ncbi:MAG: helix-hairpin-helix domain-containing protein [Comamonadaceae bacterium]|nr:MAG: helix-hairpin-helix domain-containing protein [Comamonadaceae bacterium]